MSLLNALKRRYEPDIACAKAIIQVYIDHHTAIGDHPDLVSAMDSEVAKLCEAEDKLKALDQHFGKPF